MNQDGYTLAETLAALVIIGLTVGGLVVGVDVLGRVQTKATVDTGQADHAIRLDSAFARFLEQAGPFRSDDPHGLQGDDDRFSYACGDDVCSAEIDRGDETTRLVLTDRRGTVRSIDIGKGAFVFDYQDEQGHQPDWPPSDLSKPRSLRAIGILEPRLGEELPVAEARLFIEQPAVCAFDAISRTCRAEAAP